MNSKQDHPMHPVSQMEPQRSRIKFAFAISMVTVLITAGVVLGLISSYRHDSSLGAEMMALSIPAVTLVSPKPGQPTSGLPLPAEIKPWVEAPIYARASGYLKRRLVDIGSQVEAGQLLAEIDTPELDQELERSRAQFAQAEASLGLAKITAGRWAVLLKTASVSEQEAAEKKADLKLKTALADSARAEVRRLEKLQAFSRVIAPFAGTVTVRNIDSGDLIVTAGNKEIFHLVQTRRLRVFVSVPQAMARGIAVDQSAEMSLPELPGRVFSAKVIRTAGVIAADSRTLLVELEVDNAGGEVLAGSYAQIRFTEAKKEVVLTLPSNTVLFRSEGPQIVVVQSDSKVEVRSVKLGHDFGQRIEIVAGVTPQDRVIVNPSESLVNGAMVKVLETVQTEKKP